MIKPNNYEKVQTGDYTPPKPGGHHMLIMNVREMQSKTGKPMLAVYVDFAKNDVQPAYMSSEYNRDIRPDKKWPYAGTIYVVSVDNDGNCSKNFKSFITSFERSNNCEVNWAEGEAFSGQFRGKKIGGVYGRVEDEYNGERKMRTQLRWFCEDSKVDSVKVPEDKMLPAKPETSGSSFQLPNFTKVEGVETPW